MKEKQRISKNIKAQVDSICNLEAQLKIDKKLCKEAQKEADSL